MIDADKLMEVVMATCLKEMDVDSPIEGMSIVLDRIYNASTVDAVEVVHCEECAYRRSCMLQHFVESNAVDGAKIDWSDWYCADGVRDISKSDERLEK